MKKLIATAALVSLAVGAGAPVLAQGGGAPQSIAVIDVQQVAQGFRTSKVTGSAVVNQGGERIGTVDDLIVSPRDRVLFAVVSVGGFLGIGEKLVVVPYQSLEVTPERIILAGATKDALQAMPEFKYTR